MFQCVKESIVCVTNGEEKVFENEKAAEEYYATLYGKYEVREISVKKVSLHYQWKISQQKLLQITNHLLKSTKRKWCRAIIL